MAAAFPTIIPSRALGLAGTVAPSNRIALGFVGLGQEGKLKNFRRLLGEKEVQVRGLCEVHGKRLHGAHLTMQTYAAIPDPKAYRDCILTGDFRELVTRDDIDGIVVSTPDHWHALISLWALRHGKDVLCEKPISHTIHEGRVVSDAVTRYGRVFQVASESRWAPSFLRAAQLVRNGRIGALRHIEVCMLGGFGSPGMRVSPQPKVQQPPDDFDYDMWLGPAPQAPFCFDRCLSYRFNFDYGGGNLCEWGPHLLDVVQWANNTEHTGPVEVYGTAEFPDDGLFNVPLDFDLTYTYADGLTLNCSTHGELLSEAFPAYIQFHGEDGWIRCGFGDFDASSDKLKKEQLGPGDDPLNPNPCTEHRAFLNAMLDRRQPYTPAEAGHRTATISHLGNIALRLGQRLQWNPATEKFVNNDAANRLVNPGMRAPWSLDL
jgi:predicted dehydrogenase